jgi:diguanylate cyclase (GGDEF)-like protein
MLKWTRDLSFRTLVSIAAGTIGAAIVAIGATVWALRADAVERATRDSGNIATILSEQIAWSVRSIDQSLSEIRDRLGELGAATPEQLGQVSRTPEMYQYLVERLIRLPQADVLVVVDAEGYSVASTRSYPPPNLNGRDRDYFLHHLANNDRKLFISAPLEARGSGEWTVFFSRRVNSPTGEFLGVVMAGIRIGTFRYIYKSIELLPGQSFLLLRTDGTVLVRYPAAAPGAGLTMPALSPWHGLVARGGGHYRSPGHFDGVPQLVALRPLKQYPLVVNVTVTEATALANWRHRTLQIGVGALLAVLCSIFLLKALTGQFRRVAEKSRELEEANERFAAALNNMSHGVCMFDAEKRVVVCNERYAAMYGLKREEVAPGTPLQDIIARRIARGIYAGSNPQDYMRERLAPVVAPSRDVQELSNGRAIVISRQPTSDGGWVTTHEDVTERRRAEARIAHLAGHDALTDLANRVTFMERMAQALAALRRRGDGFAVFVLDLDRFKAVNDSCGHPVGDKVLRQVADRLRAYVRENDTVARFGGDEFAILQMIGGEGRSGAITLARRLLAAVGAPYSIDGHEVVIGTSIGIALAPEHGSEADQLLMNADLALYRAKMDGRNAVFVFEPQIGIEARSRHALEADLRNALARGEFEPHYQIMVDAATERVCAAEALLRWRHPQQGLILPDRFIAIAEESGVIVPIGEWMLRRALADASRWPADVKLAVNLSPAQLRRANLPDVVSAALAEAQFPPQRLELEITESVLLEKNPSGLDSLRQLQGLGVAIVLDDFGTGYSPLSYLRIFTFDKIKIDRSFVGGLTNRAECAAIVGAVTGLGKSLNITTTAEGVETRQQFDLLRAAGCDQLQGYLFGRPCPAAELDFARGTALSPDHKAA